jgi:hypothetical protein
MRPLSVGKNLTANTKTTVFTTPTRQVGRWLLAHISNHTGNNKAVSMWWYDKSENTEVVVIDQYSLDAKKTLQFGGGNIYVALEEGDEIRITSETGSTMSIIVTVELEGNSAVQYSQY